jgi:uncharacterized protein YjbJ (UPF0337 family)
MNWQEIDGNWEQIKRGLRLQWSELTQEEIETIRGDKEELVALLQERYGLAREAAEDAVEEWRQRL